MKSTNAIRNYILQCTMLAKALDRQLKAIKDGPDSVEARFVEGIMHASDTPMEDMLRQIWSPATLGMLDYADQLLKEGKRLEFPD